MRNKTRLLNLCLLLQSAPPHAITQSFIFCIRYLSYHWLSLVSTKIFTINSKCKWYHHGCRSVWDRKLIFKPFAINKHSFCINGTLKTGRKKKTWWKVLTSIVVSTCRTTRGPENNVFQQLQHQSLDYFIWLFQSKMWSSLLISLLLIFFDLSFDLKSWKFHKLFLFFLPRALTYRLFEVCSCFSFSLQRGMTTLPQP